MYLTTVQWFKHYADVTDRLFSVTVQLRSWCAVRLCDERQTARARTVLVKTRLTLDEAKELT